MEEADASGYNNGVVRLRGNMDLRTDYLGLDLKNPIVAAASPLSYSLDGIRRLEDAGAAAIVLFSVFEEQISNGDGQVNLYLDLQGNAASDNRLAYPKATEYRVTPDGYLEHIARARQSAGIPIIASLNGVSAGEWLTFAKSIEQAGAAAIELNLYYVPTDIELTSLTTEWMYLDAVAEVADMVNIPLAVKVSPFFSAMPWMLNKLAGAGANGLVLFNRFYQPELDIEALEAKPGIQLSRSEDLTLPIRWVSLLHGRIPADFAVTGGVHTYRDVIKSVMAGANVVMMAAELLQNGVERIGEILSEMAPWMEAHEFGSIDSMRGFLSERFAVAPEIFERGSYARALVSYADAQRRAASNITD